jgi:UDPglucose--hexose-1-phosphate uridylyltransferase
MPHSPGWSLRVVPNKFAVLHIEGALNRRGVGMFDTMNGIGAHEVIIETAEHQATLANLSEESLQDVIYAYRDRILDLSKDRRFRSILVSKNHGSGAWHSHSQIYAFPVVPSLIREELEGSESYFSQRERCVYCDMIDQEVSTGVRIVSKSAEFVVLSPYAARFPFETWILPNQHLSAFELGSKEIYEGLAGTLKNILMRIDEVLGQPRYDLGLHTSPVQRADNSYYHWHFELVPRLADGSGLERATGFYINPTPPEDAAHFLRTPGETDTASEGPEWDLFVCHASEDKDAFVRPLVHKLRQRGLKVWYDELALKMGDSLRRSIDKGLNHSRYGLVVLSPAFFSREWPQRELDGLTSREIGGRKVILPIWHDVSVEEVRSYSSILADRVAASSADGLDIVIQKIVKAIG